VFNRTDLNNGCIFFKIITKYVILRQFSDSPERVISGFRCGISEIFVLLGCCAAYVPYTLRNIPEERRSECWACFYFWYSIEVGCVAHILEDGGSPIFMVRVIKFDQALNLPSFNVNRNPTRCNNTQIFIYCKITLHISGVTAPIISSTKNCNRSLR